VSWRWPAGTAAGVLAALLNSALGAVALRGQGEPDPDGLWLLVGLALAATTSAVGALGGALRLR
jgi:hypothetical protein